LHPERETRLPSDGAAHKSSGPIPVKTLRPV
jgi:hypothetical protein